jgi:hypothetical protein
MTTAPFFLIIWLGLGSSSSTVIIPVSSPEHCELIADRSKLAAPRTFFNVRGYTTHACLDARGQP